MDAAGIADCRYLDIDGLGAPRPLERLRRILDGLHDPAPVRAHLGGNVLTFKRGS